MSDRWVPARREAFVRDFVRDYCQVFLILAEQARRFEHDGSYPGDVCASTRHAHHKGLDDSQWNQYYKLTELYRWMRAMRESK